MQSNTVIKQPWYLRCINVLDGVTRLACRWASYLTVVMVAIMLANVIFRYGFEMGWIALQESVTYLHATAFLLGLGYTLQVDGHVRVDVFYRRFNTVKQAKVNVVGTILLLIPVCVFLLYYSIPYALDSWRLFETSKEPGGLPLVFILKSIIPVGVMLLLLQGLSDALKNIVIWKTAGDRQVKESH